MEDVPTTLDLPPWLREGAEKAAHKQGMHFDDMVRLVLYEYAEKHAWETLSVTQENIPFIVRFANSLLVSAIEKRASEIRLIPKAGMLSVEVQIEGTFEELSSYPGHIGPQAYDRFVTMASHGVGVRQASPGGWTPGEIQVTSRGSYYNLLLEWSGSYQHEMVLRFAGSADV